MNPPQFAAAPPPIDPAEDIWGSGLHPAGCDHCKEAHLVTNDRLGQLCPNCARSKLRPQPARLRPEPPELLLPFQQSDSQLRATVENFTKEVRFRLDDFTPQKLLQRLTPVFWPMWLVDSDVVGVWQAEVGYNYEVKSSRESYSGGGWHTEELIETRVRWEPRTGQLIRSYDNITVPALSDHKALAGYVGRYKTGGSQPYSAGQLEVDTLGMAALRIPDMRPEQVWPLAQPRFDKSAGTECQQAAGAQHIREFSIEASYEALNWTQLLLPMYVTWYTDDEGRRHPLYINGQSGKMGGIRLASQRKGRMWGGILGVVALALFVLGAILTLSAALFPPLFILGIPLIIVAFVTAIAALYPIMWPRRWNKQQLDKRG